MMWLLPAAAVDDTMVGEEMELLDDASMHCDSTNNATQCPKSAAAAAAAVEDGVEQGNRTIAEIVAVVVAALVSVVDWMFGIVGNA